MQDINQSSFISTLFDLTFTRFISETLISVLYMVAVILAGIAVIVGVITAFTNEIIYGVTSLVLAPIIFFIYVIAVRVLFEFVIVIFRIADHARQIAENTGNEAGE